MAILDLTSQYFDPKADIKYLTPHWDQARLLGNAGGAKTDPNLDYKYQRTTTRRRASMPTHWYNRASWAVPPLQRTPPDIPNYAPSTPQFSGHIVPAKEREAFLCYIRNDGRIKRREILEAITVDATGYFESRGKYPVRPNGEYVLFVEGDDTHESKDFLLNSPVGNEWQYGKNPDLTAVHNSYDTSQNLRTLLVHDTFLGNQGGTLNGRGPDTVSPGPWVASGVNTGAHADAGGNFVAYTLGSGSTAVIDTGASDVLMHMDFVPGDASLVDLNAGFILRWTNSLNFLVAGLGSITTSRPQLTFIEYVSGAPTIVNQRSLPYMNPLNVDQYYQWKLLAKNDVIWYQFSDGKKIWSDRVIKYTRYQSNTLHGFYINSGQYVDNFKVWTV